MPRSRSRSKSQSRRKSNSKSKSKGTRRRRSKQSAGSQVQDLYNQFMALQAGGNAGGHPNMMALLQQMGAQRQGQHGGESEGGNPNMMALLQQMSANEGAGMAGMVPGAAGQMNQAQMMQMMAAMQGARGNPMGLPFAGGDYKDGKLTDYNPSGVDKGSEKYIQITYYRKWQCGNCKLFDTHYDRLVSHLGEQRDKLVATLVAKASGGMNKDDVAKLKNIPFVRSNIIEIFSDTLDLPKDVHSSPAITLTAVYPTSESSGGDPFPNAVTGSMFGGAVTTKSFTYHYEDIHNRANSLYGNLMLHDRIFNFMWKDAYYPMFATVFPEYMDYAPFYFLTK